MKRSSLFLAVGAVAAVGFAAFATQAARQPLFITMKAAPAGITTDASYRALADHRATESVQLVQADASQIDAKSERKLGRRAPTFCVEGMSASPPPSAARMGLPIFGWQSAAACSRSPFTPTIAPLP